MTQHGAASTGDLTGDNALRICRYILCHGSADIETKIIACSGIGVVIDDAKGTAAGQMTKSAHFPGYSC